MSQVWKDWLDYSLSSIFITSKMVRPVGPCLSWGLRVSDEGSTRNLI